MCLQGLEALAAKNRRDHAFHAAAERLARAASQSPIKGSGSPLKPKLTPAARRFQEEKVRVCVTVCNTV